MDMARSNSYKNALLEISTTIGDDDLTRMKFKSDSVIKKRQSEKIQNSLEFFSALEERGYLSETNVSFLKDLLKTCCAGKVDGLRILESYERGYIPGSIQAGHPNVGPTMVPSQFIGPGLGQISGQPSVVYVVQNGQLPAGLNIPTQSRPRYEGPDLTAEISFLCKNLGREWKFFIRALGVEESEIDAISSDCRTVRERIHQGLLSWQCQEQKNASRQSLVCALKHTAVERNDLASKLADGNY